jgi:hypothetical protein
LKVLITAPAVGCGERRPEQADRQHAGQHHEHRHQQLDRSGEEDALLTLAQGPGGQYALGDELVEAPIEQHRDP